MSEQDRGQEGLGCACDVGPSIGAHFDAKVRRMELGSQGTLHAATRGLLELLPSPEGRSLLELGSGRGGLLADALTAGAAHVTGVELSAASVEAARTRLENAGLSDRATLFVGDGATLSLEPHDWVVLDRVICCYPDADALIANTAPAARNLYGFSVPDSRGLRGIASRVSRALDNNWNRFRKRPCTTYVHDLGRIDRRLTAAGFIRRGEAHRGLWYLAVYARA